MKAGQEESLLMIPVKSCLLLFFFIITKNTLQVVEIPKSRVTLLVCTIIKQVSHFQPLHCAHHPTVCAAVYIDNVP